MLLKMQCSSGKRYYLQCYKNETIADVKQLLEEKFGINTSTVMLTKTGGTAVSDKEVVKDIPDAKLEITFLGSAVPGVSATGNASTARQTEHSVEVGMRLKSMTEELKALGFTDTANIEKRILEAGFVKATAIAALVKDDSDSVKRALSPAEKRAITMLMQEFPGKTERDILTVYLSCGKNKTSTKLFFTPIYSTKK